MPNGHTCSESEEHLGDGNQNRTVAGGAVIEVHPHERATFEFDGLEKAVKHNAHERLPLRAV